VSKSGISADEALGEYFMDGCQPRLLEKIFTMEKLLVKIVDWFTAASKFDTQWRRTKAIISKIRKETLTYNSDYSTSPNMHAPSRGPDAMEVYGLSK
jgi:hypothetical protein